MINLGILQAKRQVQSQQHPSAACRQQSVLPKVGSDCKLGSSSGSPSGTPDPRRRRGSTIPSIQEFLDAIEKVPCRAKGLQLPQSLS